LGGGGLHSQNHPSQQYSRVFLVREEVGRGEVAQTVTLNDLFDDV